MHPGALVLESAAASNTPPPSLVEKPIIDSNKKNLSLYTEDLKMGFINSWLCTVLKTGPIPSTGHSPADEPRSPPSGWPYGSPVPKRRHAPRLHMEK